MTNYTTEWNQLERAVDEARAANSRAHALARALGAKLAKDRSRGEDLWSKSRYRMAEGLRKIERELRSIHDRGLPDRRIHMLLRLLPSLPPKPREKRVGLSSRQAVKPNPKGGSTPPQDLTKVDPNDTRQLTELLPIYASLHQAFGGVAPSQAPQEILRRVRAGRHQA